MSDTEARPVRCQNCDWTGTEDQTHELRDIWSRVEPGDVMPAGECPECDSAAMLSEGTSALAFNVLHLVRLARTANLTVDFDLAQMGKSNCIFFIDLNEAGDEWTAIFSCPSVEAAEDWVRKYIAAHGFPDDVPAQPPRQRHRMICERCGGEDVMVDAWATWDVDEQRDVLVDTFDHSFCRSCDGETCLQAVEIVEAAA